MSHGFAVRVGLLGVALVLASCAKHEGSAPIVCGPQTDDAPTELACTGLYADFETGAVAKTARPYAPAVSLWSDGYEKSRWIELPDGTADRRLLHRRMEVPRRHQGVEGVPIR